MLTVNYQKRIVYYTFIIIKEVGKMNKLKIALKVLEYAVIILCAFSKYCEEQPTNLKKEE